MRINSIHIKNFRQYEEVHLDFPNYNTNDIHVIVGRNGVGKTTLLNAINWCLYGDEPHAFSEDKNDSLPLYNINVFNNNDANLEVSVKIEVYNEEEGTTITFERIQYFNKGKGNKPLYNVSEKDEKGQTTFIDPDHTVIYTNHFVKKDFRQFFFFDGEQLDTYFKLDNIKNIESNILDVSQISLLNKTNRHLQEVQRSYDKKANKNNPKLEVTDNLIQKTKEQLEYLKNEIKYTEQIINENETEKEHIITQIINKPDVSLLEKEREELQQKIESKSEKIDKQEYSIYENNLKILPSLYLYNHIVELDSLITDKIDKNELPPLINEDLIKKTINNKKCEICGQTLAEDVISILKDTIDEYTLSSTESKKLLKLQPLLIKNKEQIENYSKFNIEAKKALKEYKNNLDELQDKLDEIDKQYEENNMEEIKQLHKDRKTLENTLKENRDKLSQLTAQQINLDKNLKEKQKQRENDLKKDKENKILSEKIKLCEKSINAIKKTIDEIKIITKNDVEEYTSKHFFNLIWKKETYDKVLIDDNYNIKLYRTGTEINALGSASAAERELLALSYTLGIHHVSGFNSPLLIDTPLARVSDDHRINFAKTLIEVSKNKQIILLFTPDEFSNNIQDLFEDMTKYIIEISENEQYSDIKVIE